MRSRQMMIAMGLLLVGTICVQSPASAFDAYTFNKDVAATLVDFDKEISNSEDLINNAAGVLVCPKISKIGLGVGLEKGACALQVDGETVAYYKGSSASFGLTAGISAHSQVMGFMTEESLEQFKAKEKGWTSGVDGTVALATVGAGGKANFKGKPIALVAWGQKGLIADLSVAGGTYKLIGSAEDYAKYGVPLHRFVATADVSDRQSPGASTAQMTIDIQGWIDDTTRTAMGTMIRDDGTVAARTALAEMPTVGTVRIGGKVTELQWARYIDMGDNNYRIILASSEPVSNALAQHLVGQVKDDMTIMQLDIDAKHVGTGVLQIGPEIGVESDGRITIQQRRVNPVKITSVSYKELD
ncbi:MAG: YSC84-related protein [Thermoanaerobaculia bacterium]